jgi:Asp-tRNA(Asn)/Glu-tRNA(Gln) amidotransferase A subunit family amidase
MTGYFPLPSGVRAQLTAAGPMARTVEDLVLALPLIMGADWRDPLTVSGSFQNPITVDLRRISAAFYVDNGIIPPTAETGEVVKKAAGVLSEAGVGGDPGSSAPRHFPNSRALLEPDGRGWRSGTKRHPSAGRYQGDMLLAEASPRGIAWAGGFRSRFRSPVIEAGRISALRVFFSREIRRHYLSC